MMALIGAAARFLTRVAAVFLLAMVAVNVVDVGLRSGLNAPVFGAYEIVEFLLAAVAFLAIPEAFLRDQHITIELIDQVVPPRVVDWLRAIGTLFALVFVALLAWHMVRPTLDYMEFNEVSMDLQLPLVWKAGLILAGIVASVATAFALFLRDLGRAAGRGA
jgi:TRAP-type C4-dicarboxylate transport system permease small subunit